MWSAAECWHRRIFEHFCTPETASSDNILLLQFFPKSHRIPWVFQVQKIPLVFWVFQLCGHPGHLQNYIQLAFVHSLQKDYIPSRILMLRSFRLKTNLVSVPCVLTQSIFIVLQQPLPPFKITFANLPTYAIFLQTQYMFVWIVLGHGRLLATQFCISNSVGFPINNVRHCALYKFLQL